jgi:hypothetical protein
LFAEDGIVAGGVMKVDRSNLIPFGFDMGVPVMLIIIFGINLP